MQKKSEVRFGLLINDFEKYLIFPATFSVIQTEKTQKSKRTLSYHNGGLNSFSPHMGIIGVAHLVFHL